MTIPILAAGRLLPYLRAELDRRFDVTALPEDNPGDWLRFHGGPFRGVATTNALGFDAAWFDAMPQLEIISSFGVGMDSLPLDEAAARGIAVRNTPEVLNDDTANMALALLLAVTRNVVANDRFVREGKWGKAPPPPLGTGLAGKTAGILGLGGIGLSVARKLEVFGCDIAYHNRRPRDDLPYRYCPDAADLAAQSDILVATLPGGDATRQVIDARVFEALGPRGIFVNIARGSVVDQPALNDALKEGRIAAAGLDVFADEPRVPEALIAMENVVLQPHQASATTETREAMADLVVRNLTDHFEA